MRRRAGFTLVEMMVAVALVLFIMVILTEAFGKGLETFRQLKAIGDLESRLRAAATLLRRDLASDHFEGRRKLSDPNNRWNAMGLSLPGLPAGIPREGFFRIDIGAAGAEGSDSDGIAAGRRADQLYMTVKLRGNERGDFFTANIPKMGATGPSPLLNPALRTNFFDQPMDARYQDTPSTYSGQWAEVKYLLVRTGSTGRTDLFTLFRGQLAVVSDNSKLNWRSTPPTPGFPLPAAALNQHREMSCRIDPATSLLYFNNPTDLNLAANRTQQHRSDITTWNAVPLLTDVVSFQVDAIRPANAADFAAYNLDTQNRGNFITAVRITLRVWDQKTQQSRQISIVQDM